MTASGVAIGLAVIVIVQNVYLIVLAVRRNRRCRHLDNRFVMR